jgi:hypothetical protein
MYDAFNIPVTYETAPEAIKQIIDKHEENYKPLITMTCVSWEGAGGGEIKSCRYLMLFNAQDCGFIVCEMWLNPDDTVRREAEVFIASDEADVFAGFMKIKQGAA